MTPAPRPDSRPGQLLVFGPGAQGRGGITSVIRLHALTETWRLRSGEHLSTFDDRGPWHKIWAALRAYALAPFKIWRAEIVHVHLAAQTSLLRKLPILWMTRTLRRPLLVHIHAPSEDVLFTRTPPRLVRYTFLSASRVIALSPGWAAIMLRHVPQARITVLPNPVVARPPRHPATGADPIVLFVGKLEPRKGYADLLAAASLVLREFPAAQFHFAGQGELPQAQALADRLGIAASVHLAGWVQGPSLDALFARATLLALPSYGEGVPMSVIEAMSHGLPVVCTPVGGLPELVIDGINGLFTPPGNAPALAASILRLLRDPALAAILGEAGRATVNNTCTVEAVSAQLETLYREVLAERSAPDYR